MYITEDHLWDLQDEGLLATEIPLQSLLRNISLIGEDNLNRLKERIHWSCSVNQTQLSGWTWLIGGAKTPMMCVAKRRYDCQPLAYSFQTESVILFFACVFTLLNLVNMAVWFRFKASCWAAQHEVGIQLVLLRVFSALDFSSTLVLAVLYFCHESGSTRVFSIFHAIIMVHFLNLAKYLFVLSHKLSIVCNLLTSVYLVEFSHVAQTVLLFLSPLRAKVMLGVAMLVCACISIVWYLQNGYLYCTRNEAAYVLTTVSYRIPRSVLAPFIIFVLIAGKIMLGLTAILLIVHASKRCCACCIGSGQPNTGTVTYVKHDDDAADDEEARGDPAQPQVVIVDVGTSTMQQQNSVGLSDELRRLIFWQQTAYYIIFILTIVLNILVVLFHKRLSTHLGKIIMLLIYILQFARLTLLSPVLSPTFRTGFRSLLVELKESVLRVARRVRASVRH